MCCLGRVGLGRLGGLPLRNAGWLTVSREACFSRVGLVAWCVWCRKHARCGGLLGLLWSWWSAVVGAPLCWGWHAVGVLGQCALVAWPAFSASLFVGGVGVGVGGLVVNCIVDASILL